MPDVGEISHAQVVEVGLMRCRYSSYLVCAFSHTLGGRDTLETASPSRF